MVGHLCFQLSQATALADNVVNSPCCFVVTEACPGRRKLRFQKLTIFCFVIRLSGGNAMRELEIAPCSLNLVNLNLWLSCDSDMRSCEQNICVSFWDCVGVVLTKN